MEFDNMCEQQMRFHDGEACPSCAATLRAVYDRAFDAALAGMPRVGMDSDCDITGLVLEADMYALAAVRTHAARMVKLADVIAELEGETE